MNSNSRYCDDYEPCKDPCKRDKKPSAPITMVKCGAPGSISIPVATLAGTTFTLASLTTNTAGICNPCTKIEVAMNITALAFLGSINFQVFKQCRNQFQPIPVGAAFTFSRIVAITESTTFSFFVCDCDTCENECCSYTLVATVTTVTVGDLNINNATLGAITASSNCECC